MADGEPHPQFEEDRSGEPVIRRVYTTPISVRFSLSSVRLRKCAKIAGRPR